MSKERNQNPQNDRSHAKNESSERMEKAFGDNQINESRLPDFKLTPPPPPTPPTTNGNE